jgi:hypothetical protein
MKINILLCLVFIAFVGAHILEERFKNLRDFFNIKWFKTGDPDFPVTPFEALWKDQVGLFLILATMACLAYAGVFGGITILIAVGFITADTIQHSVFSIARPGYTPGIATSVLYAGYVLYFYLYQLKLAVLYFGTGWTIVYTGLGGFLLLLNYLVLSIKANNRLKQESKTGKVKGQTRTVPT